jgi:transposase
MNDINAHLDSGLDRMSNEYAGYVGLDVHKDTIAVAVALPGREAAYDHGEIANNLKAIKKLVNRLSKQFEGQVVLFVYEAGPCGYDLYWQLTALGHDCQVVAPGLIPKKPSERIKTDRRDARKLAVNARSGELTPVWVPDAEQEAMRDLTRTRDDFKGQERKARQQLNAFLLRHSKVWPTDKSRWTKTHWRWLEELRFEQDWQQIVLQSYIDAVREATARVTAITTQMERALPQWSLAPVVHSLVALRGVDKITAMVLMAELGDISRFDHPRQLMAFLGLVPSEHSSGDKRQRGSITRTGNRHARRVLVESAWCYRFPPRQTAHLRRKAANASKEAQAIAWKAQKRLCCRYSDMIRSGKNTKVVTVAVARELVGFIWDIVCQEMPKVRTAA